MDLGSRASMFVRSSSQLRNLLREIENRVSPSLFDSIDRRLSSAVFDFAQLSNYANFINERFYNTLRPEDILKNT